ncbi:MAG: hypothetical protein K0R25_151 [Rickettsiaceae bacterium]|jgi:hypothetical protein|nr:hypothetical protein [Rickettsiaceae bacterium]
MRHIKITLLIFFLSSCNALTSGILGRIPTYDNNEYQQVVELQVLASEAEEFCDRPIKDFRGKIDEINHRLKVLDLYSKGLEYNEPIISQIELIEQNVSELDSRLNHKKISKTYCREKTKNLELMFDILRQSVGEKKHAE